MATTATNHGERGERGERGAAERSALDELSRRDARATLPGSDFREPPAPRKRTVCMPFGLTGEGKTWTVLMHAPHPIAYFDIDRRGWYAAQEAVKAGRRIHYVDIPYPAGIARAGDERSKQIAQTSVDRFTRNYEVSLRESERGNVVTTVADTLTELYELYKIAVEGRVDKKPTDYGKARGITNASFKSILKMARTEGNANFVGIARGKRVFEDPSMVEYEGPDFFDFDMDWSAWIRRRVFASKHAEAKVPIGDRFELLVTKAGYVAEERGAVYGPDDWGPLGPFAYACMQNHPGSKASDWR